MILFCFVAILEQGDGKWNDVFPRLLITYTWIQFAWSCKTSSMHGIDWEQDSQLWSAAASELWLINSYLENIKILNVKTVENNSLIFYICTKLYDLIIFIALLDKQLTPKHLLSQLSSKYICMYLSSSKHIANVHSNYTSQLIMTENYEQCQKTCK